MVSAPRIIAIVFVAAACEDSSERPPEGAPSAYGKTIHSTMTEMLFRLMYESEHLSADGCALHEARVQQITELQEAAIRSLDQADSARYLLRVPGLIRQCVSCDSERDACDQALRRLTESAQTWRLGWLTDPPRTVRELRELRDPAAKQAFATRWIEAKRGRLQAIGFGSVLKERITPEEAMECLREKLAGRDDWRLLNSTDADACLIAPE